MTICKRTIPRYALEFGGTIVLASLFVRQFSASPMNIALLSLGAVAAIPLFLKKPEYAVFALVVLIPFRDVHIISIIHLKRLCIWSLVGYAILRQLENPQRPFSRSLLRFTVASGIFLTALAVSLLKTASELYSSYEVTPAMLKTTLLSDGAVIVEQILIVYIMYYLLTTTRPLTRLLDVLLGVAGIVSGLGVLQYVFGGPPPLLGMFYDPVYSFYGRATSVFSNPNSLGGFTAHMLVLACITLLLYDMTRWKRICFVFPVMLVTASALILSFSRGAILQLLFGLFIAGGTYYLKVSDRKLNWKFVSLAGVAMGALIAVMLLYDLFLRARLRTYGYNDYQAALNWLESISDFRRKHAVIAALKTFGQHPLLGIGYNLFTAKSAAGLEFLGLPVHNQYLKILAEMGIFGFLSFLAILGTVVRAAFRPWDLPPAQRPDQNQQILMCIFLAGFGTLCFGFLFGDPLPLISTSGYMWLYAGAIFILDCQHHQVEQAHGERAG